MAATSAAPSGGNALKNRIVELVNKIHSAPSINDILTGLTTDLQAVCNAERVTIFAVDTKNQQLYSMAKAGDELKEIRVPKNFGSIVGFTAMSRQIIGIRDAYDTAELQKIHPKLSFDQKWDKQSGFRTCQVLAVPIVFEKGLLGVIQAINRQGGGAFTKDEALGVQEIARTVGIAFHNQRKTTQSGKPSPYNQLIQQGILSEKDLETAAGDARINNCSLEKVLIEKIKVPKADLLASMAQFYGVQSWEFTGEERIPDELRPRVSVDYMKKNLWAPVDKQGHTVVIAIDNPHSLTKLDMIKATNLSPQLDIRVAITEDITKVIDKTFGAALDAIDELIGEVDTDDLIAEEIEEEEDDIDEEDASVVKLANAIIRDAYRMGVSDIHVEPYGDKDETVIRFRTDGICAIYKKLPPALRNAVVSRFKIMARLDITERRKPQDGKIRFRSKKGAIELRVATIPTTGNNEDVVMRILAGSEPILLEQMLFSERNLREWKVLLAKPYGICLVVGPTGSGKTTTLHSGLGFINKPERKIWTAEDPVEITQKGLRQVQVLPKIGFTFANAMRAFLRADPDVIMVGEMRDRETAQTGIEASLTGHLVFSTLHTNSAAETVTRLLDMEIDPFSFADALLGILAQRLVRTLCKDCKEPYHPERQEYDDLVEAYGPEYWPRRGIEYTDDLTLYRPKGCSECADSGSRGRMGIHELLVNSDVIKEMIQQKATVAQIFEQALTEGMETLMQDGIVKVFKGWTTMQQVRTVCMK